MKVVFIKYLEVIQSPKGHWELLIHTKETGEARSPGQVDEAKERMNHSFGNRGVPAVEGGKQ